jgi:hypothetical protein
MSAPPPPTDKTVTGMSDKGRPRSGGMLLDSGAHVCLASTPATSTMNYELCHYTDDVTRVPGFNLIGTWSDSILEHNVLSPKSIRVP